MYNDNRYTNYYISISIFMTDPTEITVRVGGSATLSSQSDATVTFTGYVTGPVPGKSTHSSHF